MRPRRFTKPELGRIIAALRHQAVPLQRTTQGGEQMTTRTHPGHRISWTGRTWNPGIFGCSLAGPECQSCYAAVMAHRGLGPYAPYKGEITKVGANGVTWTGRVFADRSRIAPSAAALPKSKPTLVFTTSMSDLYHRDVPDDFLVAVHAEMAARPHLTFQDLTKRADRRLLLYRSAYHVERVRQELQRRHPGAPWPGWPLPNVWLGVTMGDNAEPRRQRLRHLAETPTNGIRFLSVEPMFQVPDLRGFMARIDLVILGGESKYTRRQPRPFDLDGARRLIRYVDYAGTGSEVQIKQLGDAWAAETGTPHKAGGDPAYWPSDLQPYYGLPNWLAARAGLGGERGH